MQYARFMKLVFLANIVHFTVLAFFVSSCCLFEKSSSNMTIKQDTFYITRVDSVNFQGKAKIEIVKDTIIVIKPYKAKIDTILQRVVNNKIIRDTIHLTYNVLDSNFNLNYKHQQDSLIKIVIEKNKTIIKEKSIFDNFLTKFFFVLLLIVSILFLLKYKV